MDGTSVGDFQEKEKVYGRYLRILVFLVVVAVIACREPRFFLTPRMWAEEGTWFFSDAYNFSQSGHWYKGLFTAHAGYFCLWTNLAATIAANCVSVEHAPLAMLFFSLSIQLIPFGIVLWSKSSFWQSPARRAAGILVLLFTPLSGEVWLTLTNIHLHFALSIWLLLLEDSVVNRVQRWSCRMFLGLAGLSGVAPCIFSPLFLLKAHQEKSKERYIQGAILSACSALQLSLMTYNGLHGGVTKARFIDSSLSAYILPLWTQSVGLLLLGIDYAKCFADWFLAIYQQSRLGLWAAVFCVALFLGMFFAFFSKRLSSKDRIVFAGAYWLMTLASFLGSLTNNNKYALVDVGFAARYFFVPNVIVLLLLTANIQKPFRFRSGIATAMLLLSLGWGMWEYRQTSMWDDSWANWTSEVRMWRANPHHMIEVWPAPWHIALRRPPDALRK